MRICGIDPGLRGAVAILEADGSPWRIEDMSLRSLGKTRQEVDGAALARFLVEAGEIRLAVVEAVHAMPGQGVSSCFSFGRNVGVVVGVLEALGVPLLEVSPSPDLAGGRVAGNPGGREGADPSVGLPGLPRRVPLHSPGEGTGRKSGCPGPGVVRPAGGGKGGGVMNGLLAGLAGQRYADRLDTLVEAYRGLNGTVDASLVLEDLEDLRERFGDVLALLRGVRS